LGLSTQVTVYNPPGKQREGVVETSLPVMVPGSMKNMGVHQNIASKEQYGDNQRNCLRETLLTA